MNPTQQRFIQIDEEGYFKLDDLRVADAETGRAWMSDLRMDGARCVLAMQGQDVVVEYFDQPYIALDIERLESGWHVTTPYGHRETFALESLTVDEWDRFHGRTARGVPFVLSRSAQSRFFNSLEEYDDDSITVDGRTLTISPWLSSNTDATKAGWWGDFYVKNEMGWDLGEASPALSLLVPQLKLHRSRILVLGCGRGHDAAWFAQAGHIVTGVDFSQEAVVRARELYGHLSNLTFVQGDAFKLPPEMDRSFDIIFEHTLYCAISPEKRNDLVKAWRRALVDGGHIMGVFFAMDKPQGPPFGGSEWEFRARFAKSFRPLYWQRLRNSIPRRMGTEVFIYAQKRDSLTSQG